MAAMPPSNPLRDDSGSSENPTAKFPTPVPPPSSAGVSRPEPESLAPQLASSDQCANCGSPLASDQHYCLVCGERRGPARFTSLPATAGGTTTVLTEERLPPRGPRFSSASTLIAGIATLLIAMGIGIYIGSLGKSNNSGASRAQIVTVNGGGGAAAASSSTASTPSATGSSGGSKHKGKSGSKSKSSGSKVVTTVKNLPPPTVTVGAKGSGKGYQNGKFTGHVFGP